MLIYTPPPSFYKLTCSFLLVNSEKLHALTNSFLLQCGVITDDMQHLVERKCIKNEKLENQLRIYILKQRK